LASSSWIAPFVLVIALSACTDMKDQPRYEPLEPSTFFADGRSARLPVEGTVARGELRLDDHFYRGLDTEGSFAAEIPMELTHEFLLRGQERFEIFCTPCHGRSGNGNGMVVQRGYKRPPDYTEPRLMQSPNGYLFDVLSNGFGKMQGYASQIPTEDRWAIVAYVRALQLRRSATLAELPTELQERVSEGEVVNTQDREESDERAGH